MIEHVMRMTREITFAQPTPYTFPRKPNHKK